MSSLGALGQVKGTWVLSLLGICGVRAKYPFHLPCLFHLLHKEMGPYPFPRPIADSVPDPLLTHPAPVPP
jgi:hypothetical protein